MRFTLNAARASLLIFGALASIAACSSRATVPAGTSPVGGSLSTTAPIVSCASLASLDVTGVGGAGSRVSLARDTVNDGIAVCAVDAMLAPRVNVRVLLPKATYTQRYLQIGCGGLCGMISVRSGASDGCKVLANGGFVLAATDMGHSSRTEADGEWALDAQRRADFAYRAQHITAEVAKSLIRAYYGAPPRYSYFNGCSDGGREALMAAMRYPDDFDGIIAGAPAMLFQVQNTLYHAWQAASNTDANGRTVLQASRLPLLHRAVVAACDTVDGTRDGLITLPARCRFDVGSIQCPSEPAAAAPETCLTAAETEVARRFYEGPRDSLTGAWLTAGQPVFGSELEWAGVYVGRTATAPLMSAGAALPVIRYLAYDKPRPNETITTYRFNEANLAALRDRHGVYDATNPDLSAFAKAGGKLIVWHGLADPHIAPANTVAWHHALVRTLGAERSAQFERLYLLPGVSHCAGGEGPSRIDLVTPMLEWVENGRAPDMITTRGSTTPTERPVYPYPEYAQYTGQGDMAQLGSWRRATAMSHVTLREWPGASFFAPYRFLPQ